MRVFVSALVSFILIGLAGAAALIGCVPTVYSVTASAPPPTANWTTTAGLWTPSGGFPGCAPGDSAADTNASPTTVIVNSSIPNPVIGITFNSSGSVVEIDSGGVLTIDGAASFTGGSKLVINGGQLIIGPTGSLSINSSNFQMNSGQIDLQNG